jgi:uncharacterized membrane protein YphA (DoxX/SURF4 family)/peroxiredoxin
MRIITGIVRIFVGIFFIISGFVKLNDPVGFSYKLQEYFGVLDLEFLQPFALAIAVFIVIFEFMIGVTLILGYARNFTRWSLLLMILFFTFLTFYSAYFEKVTDCGCFGDALPLTPWESFWKDVVLLLLILIIFFNRRYIQPLFYGPALKYVVFIIFIGNLAFGYYVLMHLPVIDFRAYAEGVNIEEGMQPKEGKVIAPIHDFGFYNDQGDKTQEILNKDKVLVVVAYNLSKSEKKAWVQIKKAVNTAKEKGFEVVGLSASNGKPVEQLKKNNGFYFPFYFADETAIKTILRSNPGLMTLKNGTITQKLHWNDVDDFKVK